MNKSDLILDSDNDRIADIWGMDDDSNPFFKPKRKIQKMRIKKTNSVKVKTAKTKEAREIVYKGIEGNKAIKGKRGRKLIKGLAKAAHKAGNSKLSRGLWAMHTKRSAFAAGVKAALSKKR